MKTRFARRNLLEGLEARQFLHADLDVTFNFQPRESAVPAGTIPDLGYAYGDRGDSLTYGWNADNRGNARERNKVSDQKLDTLIQMQAGGNFTWELEIPNGDYIVTIGAGDPRYIGDEHHITAEGTMVMYGKTSSKKPSLKASKTITVSDGKLTLAPGPDGRNTKIQYVRIQSTHEEPESTVSIATTTATTTEGGSPGVVRLSRTGDTTADLIVNLAWSGSAGAKDIRPRPTSVTIPSGQSFVDVNVNPIDDALDEAPETAKITLTGGNYAIGTASASVTVIGAETPAPEKPSVAISATDNSATEGADTATVRFTRTGGDVTQALTLNLSWSGSAGAGDIASRPSSVTFNANSSTLDLTVTATDDALDEANETAVVTILGSDDYTVTTASASVTVVDNDPTPSDSFSNISWASAPSPLYSYAEMTPAVVDGKLYMFGGFNGVFSPQKTVQRFDGTSWVQLNDAPIAFTHTGHTLVNGKIWFAGGYIGTQNGGQTFGSTMVKIYDPSNDTWSDGPSLPQIRASGNLQKVGNKLYYFGGEDNNRQNNTPEMWMYDLDNTGAGWVTRASMPAPRTHAAAVVVNNQIIVLGGQTGYDDNLTTHNDIYIYDPANNTWTTRAEKLPLGNSHAWQSTTYYKGKIVLVAGESVHNGYVNSVVSVDATTFQVTTLTNFPEARYSAAGGVLNDKFYLFGGFQGYIPTTGYVGTFVS